MHAEHLQIVAEEKLVHAASLEQPGGGVNSTAQGGAVLQN
jgi:hypothetical protein